MCLSITASIDDGLNENKAISCLAWATARPTRFSATKQKAFKHVPEANDMLTDANNPACRPKSFNETVWKAKRSRLPECCGGLCSTGADATDYRQWTPNVALFTACPWHHYFSTIVGPVWPPRFRFSGGRRFAFIARVIGLQGKFRMEETMGGLMAGGFMYIILERPGKSPAVPALITPLLPRW